MGEVNIFFSLYVYIEVSGNHCKEMIRVHDKIFPQATDEGFRDEIGLCIRNGKDSRLFICFMN